MAEPIIYLDYNASTPVDRRVQDAMIPIFDQAYANPSSSHIAGREASAQIEGAREKVARIVNMSKSDVIFVSGATEANNLAIRGALAGQEDTKLFVGSTEHKSVIETAFSQECKRSEPELIPVRVDGTLDIDALKDAMNRCKKNTLVSIMAANGETGVINPMSEISDIVHKHGAILHCDATQAVGKIPFDAAAQGIDMLSISGHKMYGPKGVGALVANKTARRVLHAIQTGGGQEDDIRSGTLNAPGIVGLGKACEIASDLTTMNSLGKMRELLETMITEHISNIIINGQKAERLPNTSNIRFIGVDSDAILANMPTVAVSTGSACASSTMEPSHVLTAMGLSGGAANESIRFSLGMRTTVDDIKNTISLVQKAVERVRGIEASQAVRGEQFGH